MWLILRASELDAIRSDIPETSDISPDVTEIRKINGSRYKVVRSEDKTLKAVYVWMGDPYSSYATGVGYTTLK